MDLKGEAENLLLINGQSIRRRRTNAAQAELRQLRAGRLTAGRQEYTSKQLVLLRKGSGHATLAMRLKEGDEGKEGHV